MESINIKEGEWFCTIGGIAMAEKIHDFYFEEYDNIPDGKKAGDFCKSMIQYRLFCDYEGNMVRHDRIRKCNSEYCRHLDDSDREILNKSIKENPKEYKFLGDLLAEKKDIKVRIPLTYAITEGTMAKVKKELNIIKNKLPSEFTFKDVLKVVTDNGSTIKLTHFLPDNNTTDVKLYVNIFLDYTFGKHDGKNILFHDFNYKFERDWSRYKHKPIYNLKKGDWFCGENGFAVFEGIYNEYFDKYDNVPEDKRTGDFKLAIVTYNLFCDFDGKPIKRNRFKTWNLYGCNLMPSTDKKILDMSIKKNPKEYASFLEFQKVKHEARTWVIFECSVYDGAEDRILQDWEKVKKNLPSEFTFKEFLKIAAVNKCNIDFLNYLPDDDISDYPPFTITITLSYILGHHAGKNLIFDTFDFKLNKN